MFAKPSWLTPLSPEVNGPSEDTRPDAKCSRRFVPGESLRESISHCYGAAKRQSAQRVASRPHKLAGEVWFPPTAAFPSASVALVARMYDAVPTVPSGRSYSRRTGPKLRYP